MTPWLPFNYHTIPIFFLCFHYVADCIITKFFYPISLIQSSPKNYLCWWTLWCRIFNVSLQLQLSSLKFSCRLFFSLSLLCFYSINSSRPFILILDSHRLCSSYLRLNYSVALKITELFRPYWNTETESKFYFNCCISETLIVSRT